MEKKIKRNELVKIFFIAFGIFAAAIIPQLLFTGGMWVYYGDFNVQQIPFYMHVHEAVRKWNIFYDWSTDLGGSLVGCYSFYLLGSPFFWITVPFPTSFIPYLLPWVAALKYALMALFAYIYARKYLRTETGAYAAALLFAFSGYQGAVLVYNHFHDFVAFFPLWLIMFERLVEEKKKLGFIFMTALMAIINYYFFVGGALFLVIYFIARYALFERDRIKTSLSFIRAAVCGATGLILSGVYILPAIYYTIGNSRLSNTLNGYELLAYRDSVMWLGIVKNIVMLPDVSGLNSMLNPDMARVSGIGAYIPLFSLAGVIAFFFYKKGRHWAKSLLIILAVFAGVPMFNAAFSAFNSEYYARWYFMPVLIMALVTGHVLEQREETGKYMRYGALFVGVTTILIIAMSILPAKDGDGNMTVLGKLKNPEQLASEIVFCTIMFLLLLLYLYKLSAKRNYVTRIVVGVACFLTTFAMLTTGAFLVEQERKASFVNQVLKGGESPLPEEEEFYRIETDEDMYNYPMIWGAHSVTSFISTIPDSTLLAYSKFGIPRKVTSNPYTTRSGLRAILSCKYYVKDEEIAIETIGRLEDPTELKGYVEHSITRNGYKLYENENYVPMGISFDKYLTEKEFEESSATDQRKDRWLTRVIILSEKDADIYSDHIEHFDLAKSETGTIAADVAKLRETACTDFEISTNGFTATSNLEKDNLVFFSVPYEKGFRAFVDDEETRIVKADFGFMAVFVPAGTHEIEFKYVPSLLYDGLRVTCLGFVICVVIILIDAVTLKKSSSERTRGNQGGKKTTL